MISRFLHRPIGVWKARIILAIGLGVVGFVYNGMNPLGAVFFIVVGYVAAFVLFVVDRRRHRGKDIDPSN